MDTSIPSPPRSSSCSTIASRRNAQATSKPSVTPQGQPNRGWKFWMVIFSIALALFNAAIELTSVSTALPTITADLHGEEFVWVGSAYAISSTAFVPMSGGLAQIFGRKSVMLGSLAIFAAGSAVCGASKSMNVLIAGRTIQGIGGGGVASLTQIILSDMVSLQERGKFNGLVGIAWGIASGIGPVVGGALSDAGQWRWLFYLTIPVCGVSALFVTMFLSLKTPPGGIQEKFRKIDWIGNFLVISSTTSVIIALTWGGAQYPWSSFRVLVPLVLGLVGLFVFFYYEFRFANNPMVSPALLSSRTGISGYLQTFLLPFTLICLIYYLPVFFQACYGSSPTASGVLLFGCAFTIVPIGMVSSITVTIFQRYRPQLWLGWAFLIVGNGLLSTLKPSTPKGTTVGFQIIGGLGVGIVASTTYFPVLAPLDVSYNAPALALFTFLRNFAQVWGVTIGGTVLNNELQDRLPQAFLSQFRGGSEMAFSIIPLIAGLDEPLRSEVRTAFAESLRVLWQVLIGIGGMGLLTCALMKGLPLHTNVDENWGAIEKDVGGKSDKPAV